MRRAVWLSALILLSIGAGPATAQQESMAGVCAFAEMEPAERLDACDMLLRQADLSDQAKALAHLGRSLALRLIGQEAAAFDAVNEAIRLAPNLAPAYLSRSAAYLGADKYALAIGDASKAIELDRRNPSGYLIRAEAYLRQGEAAFALGDLDEAIAIAPDVARLRLVRAYANLALGHPDRVLPDARAALKLAPELVSAYLVRARAYLATEHFDRAGADAARAVELAPDDRQAWDAATIAYTELARFDRAEIAADRMVELDGGAASSLNARCWVLALKPDPAAAIDDCDAAIAADDGYFQAYDSRAFAYWQLGRSAEMQADLTRAAELAPDFWDWSLREERFATVLARRYLKTLGHYSGPLDGGFDDPAATEAAIRAYEAEVGLDPTGRPSRTLLARLAEENGVN